MEKDCVPALRSVPGPGGDASILRSTAGGDTGFAKSEKERPGEVPP